MLAGIRQKLKWVDPFTYVDIYVMPHVKALPGGRQWIVFVASFVLLALAVSLALGVTHFFIMLLLVFYAYLFIFERQEAVEWGINLLFAFIFAWAIYSFFGLALGTASPMVIVVSGSMEPLYHRGDVIVLNGTSFEQLQAPLVQFNGPIDGRELALLATPHYSSTQNGVQVSSLEFNTGQDVEITQEGSVVVYFSQRLQQPIIHRVVAKLSASDGSYVITKGDSANNNTVDQDCGSVRLGVPEKQCIQLFPVKEQDIEGRALLQVPLVGCVKLWLFDNLASLIATGAFPSDFRGVC